MKTSFNFYQLFPKVFLVEFYENYDLAMTFLRAQEFYESVNPDFQGKSFTMPEYMSWYAKTQSETKTFSYSEDWRGFNVPSKILYDCYSVNTERTPHDNLLLKIMQECNKKSDDQPYYLLGVRLGDLGTLDHEIAHGFYTTEPEYQKGIETITKDMNPQTKDSLLKGIYDMGYAPSVAYDELQAFMATGLSKKLKPLVKDDETIPFSQFFKQYKGDWSLPKPQLENYEVNLMKM